VASKEEPIDGHSAIVDGTVGGYELYT
jgi:hypothetical protein